MASNEDKLEDTKSQLAELEPLFQTFWIRRAEWQQLFRVRRPTKLESSLEAYGDGIDIQSPLLQYDRKIHMTFKMQNPTKIDAAPDGPSKPAQTAAEKQRIYYASLWNTMDAGNKIRAPWAQSTTDAGVFFARMHYRQPMEPKEDWLEERVKSYRSEDEDDDTYETKKLDRSAKARSEHFAESEDACFWLEAIGIGELCFNAMGKDKRTLTIQKSEIDFIEFTRLQRSKKLGGGFANLDEAGKVVFLGEAHAPEGRAGDDTTLSSNKFTYLVKDYQDPKTKQWMVCEYVYPNGEVDKGEKVHEDVNPLGRSIFFVVESGDSVPQETDPHLRYLPTMWAELQLTGLINYLTTKIAAISMRETTDDIYIDISKLTPDARQMMESAGAQVEGSGAGSRLVFKRPDPNSNELPLYPGKLENFPHRVSEHLMLIVQQAKDDLVSVRPNEAVQGRHTNAHTNAREAETATMGLLDKQSNSALWGPDLTNFDDFVADVMRAVRNCILFWDKGAPDGALKEYPVITTGNEPILGGSVQAGQSYTLTANDFKAHPDIRVMTKHETQAERIQNEQQSMMKYDRGELTWLQHLENLGNDDPIRIAKELELDRIRKQREPRADQLRQVAIDEYVTLKTRINVSMLQGGPPMPQNGGSGAAQPQQQGQQRPQPGPIAKPQMTPAPITGATGGNNASMGVSL
jgi:hypothetical protein